MSDCGSSCYETRSFDANGRMIRVATKDGKYRKGERHPMCDGCKNNELAKLKAMAASMKPGETVNMRDGKIVGRTSAQPTKAVQPTPPSDEELFKRLENMKKSFLV